MLLKDLTAGERLFLDRRRDEFTQDQAADWYGVTRYQYRRWESDEDQGAPKVKLGRLHDYEECVIRRRRSGEALHELARKAGISRWWLCQMEYGRVPAERLVAFWASRNGAERRRGA